MDKEPIKNYEKIYEKFHELIHKHPALVGERA